MLANMRKSALYELCGLTLESELELTEALPAPKTAGPADAAIRYGTVSPDGLANGRRLGPFCWAAPSALWLRVPEVASFLVTDGKEIVVDPHPGIDEDSVRVFLLGSALGALLSQRGLLVLHGNAIQVGDSCVICVGPSGSGKSTLAAEFMKRGFSILADDVTPVDENCCAVPGMPRIKLTQDAANRLSISTDGLRMIRPNIPKFNLPLDGDQFGLHPVPVRWIYVLSPRKSGLEIVAFHGMDRLRPLRNNTYRFGYLKGMALQHQHLQSCGRLGGRVHVSLLTRHQHGGTIEEIADVMLADMAENP